MTKHTKELGIGMAAALEGLRDRGYAPKVLYDIGAAEGSWTRLAMTYWPQATYVCFEPLSERHGELRALQAAHPKNVQVQPCGVGDQDGELSIGVTKFLWDSSFAYGGATSRKVPVRRLDTLLEEGLPQPSFIKIDVQGFEKRVLDGGRRTMQGADLILMECAFFAFCDDMRTLDVTVAYMAANGFIPYEFVDFLRRPLDGAMGQCDMLFIRRDHALISKRQWV